MLPILPPTDPPVTACFDVAPLDILGKRLSVQYDDDLMHGDEEEVEDAEYNVDPLPLTSVAGVLQPSDSSWAYVFCGNRYVTIKVSPGTMGDRTARGSSIIVDDWPSLLETKFAGDVDAVLPIPNGGNQLYFFSGENYALINANHGTGNDYVIDGPKNIIAEWPSLKDAGFKTVDAILLNPLNREQAYVFKGDQYILIHVQQDKFTLFALLVELTSVSGQTKDHIIDGPRPMWPCLKGAGFKEITMILPNPLNPIEAYVFTRDQYALISIRCDPSENYIVDGPKAIHTEWPSLAQAGFF